MAGRTLFGTVDHLAVGRSAQEANDVALVGQMAQGVEDGFVKVLARPVDPEISAHRSQPVATVRVTGE
jgi:hypothetical protein